MTQHPAVLVIGATGAFGGASAEALLGAGWRVLALHRDPDRARTARADLAVHWLKGDAMRREDVLRAAEGCRAIVHAANPPGYRNWRGLALPMLDNTIVAAVREGARILFPGNIYNYGPDAWPTIGEDAPQHPPTRKGRIRAEMERRLRQAGQDGAKVLILRAGDFFGPRSRDGWMGQGVIQAGRPVRRLTCPGPLSVRHGWAYLPDLAETARRLLAIEADLAAVASFHFAGHILDGHELVAVFERVVGRKLRVARFPWLALSALAPFNETFRELAEMRYLWRETVLLDNARLVRTLGAEPHTPIDTALDATLRGLDCLAGPSAVRTA